MARHQAYLDLAEWSKWDSRRDEIIARAADAGISKSVIAEITRLHRSTIYAIMKEQGVATS